MEEYRKYTDYDDNKYELQPYESKKGDRACILQKINTEIVY